MVTGIYCITNKKNGKKYIGQSNNIFSRWNEHIKTSFSNDESRKSVIHKAIEKYGIESFSFEVLALCSLERLNDLEMFYIKNMKNLGYVLYNLTDGGDCMVSNLGENNANAILTDKEVYDIRERYNNLEKKIDVYNLYKNKITFNGFNCIWQGTSRKNIHMDVYTKENKKIHKSESILQRNLFKFSNFTEEDVQKIRDLRQSGLCLSEVYKEYAWINKNTFNDIWYYKTFKHIKSNLEKKDTKYIRKNQDGIKNHMARYTEEQIVDIRKRKNNGEKFEDVFNIYPFVSKQSFRKIWENKSYKNIGVI